MKKAVGLTYINVGRSPMVELQQMLLSPVAGEIKTNISILNGYFRKIIKKIVV